MFYREFYTTQVAAKAQADGAQTVDTSSSHEAITEAVHSTERIKTCYNWQFQVDVHDVNGVKLVPAAGTLDISGKLPGALFDVPLVTTIDLTSSSLRVAFAGTCDSITFTPTGLDAGAFYTVTALAN